jgi:acetoin utilization deacetylase AcuC-like enzyme
MRVFAAGGARLRLPPDHRFPVGKYDGLLERAQASGLLPPEAFAFPPAVEDAVLTRAHTPAYVRQVQTGDLTAAEMRRIGFPWSPELAERAARSVASTVAAARAALEDGIAMHLGGGTHHAYADHGEGFCVFNDVAVAARQLQAEGRVQRVLILDCDVHQGNGTAAIFQDDPTVFTLSIHGAKNFPFHKEESDVDIALSDGSGDAVYLCALQPPTEFALMLQRPDLVFYIAGADPFADDRLGRMALSQAGLAARDAWVFQRLTQAGLPVAVVTGGGYARQVEDIVAIHLETFRQAVAVSWGRRNFSPALS